jgi:hypothetical protein
LVLLQFWWVWVHAAYSVFMRVLVTVWRIQLVRKAQQGLHLLDHIGSSLDTPVRQMDDPCLSARVDAWRQVLSPWIVALTGRLSLPLDWTPCQKDLHEDLWIEFNAEDTAETRLVWRTWLEAFELLGLLASSDSRACWKIFHNLTNQQHKRARAFGLLP